MHVKKFSNTTRKWLTNVGGTNVGLVETPGSSTGSEAIDQLVYNDAQCRLVTCGVLHPQSQAKTHFGWKKTAGGIKDLVYPFVPPPGRYDLCLNGDKLNSLTGGSQIR